MVIAEDEAIIRLDLKEILQDEGYDVVGETGRGDEAVDLVREHQPDLVILDVKMPGSDGLAAARAIRDLDLKVAVLILTAFSQRNLIDEARDAGVAAYLVKPFQRIELIPAIDQAMARCEQEWAIDAEARQAPPRTGGRPPGHRRGQARDPAAGRRGQGRPDGAVGDVRDRGLRLHPEDGHGDPVPDDRRRPPGPRGHARALARASVDRGRQDPRDRTPHRSLAPTGRRPIRRRPPHPPRRDVAGLPGLLRPAARSGHHHRRGHQRRPRVRLHGGEPGPGPPPGGPGRRLRPPRGNLPRRDRRRLQGGSGRDPPDLPPQFDMIRALLGSLAIPVVGAEGFEADDVLATLATEARDRKHPVIIVTGDRDAYQLVEDPYVRVLYNRRGVSDYALYDEAGIEERTGVRPEKYPLLAALRGDPSDNLPGVPGVGEKTAAKLVNEYGDLDTLFAHLDALSPKLRQNLAANAERVRINAEVIPLVRDVPLDVHVDELALGGWDPEEARQSFDEFELRSLWPRFSP